MFVFSLKKHMCESTAPHFAKSRIILCGQFVEVFTHIIINDIPLNAVIAFENMLR